MRRLLAALLALSLVVGGFPADAWAAGSNSSKPPSGAPPAAVPPLLAPASPQVPGLPALGDPNIPSNPGTAGFRPPAAAEPAAGLAPVAAAPSILTAPPAAADARPLDPAAVAAALQNLPPAAELAARLDPLGAAQAVPPAQDGRPAQPGAAQTGAQTSPETASAQAAAAFDGAPLTAEELASIRPQGLRRLVMAPWRAATSFFLKPATPKAPKFKAPPLLDEYGGPKAKKKGFWGRVGYGLSWGLSLKGVGTLLALALSPVAARFPWVLYVSDDTLEKFGRVELLNSYGPGEISELVAAHPFRFVLVNMPWSVLREEFIYRGLIFGAVFLLLAGVKPVTAKLKSWIAGGPEINGLGKVFSKILGALGAVLPRFAFPVAALVSARYFMASHYENWGINPFLMIVHFSLGLGLAYAAYRSRSLLAAVVTHFTYNLVTLMGAVIALYFAAAGAAQIYGLLLGVVSVVFLYYQIRVKLKAVRAERAEAGRKWALAAKASLLLPVAAALLIALGGRAGLQQAATHPVNFPATRAVKLDGKIPEITAVIPAANGPAAPSAAPVMTAVQLVSKVKPAVGQVFSEDGMGSGFVVSPDGLMVTNAHVARPGQVGDFLKVQFSDGRVVKAKIVAVNDDRDIALLQLPVNSKGWAFVAIGETKALQEGEDVVALGYPLGLPFTVTKGIVSGLGHRGTFHVDWLQTDAEINPGNSGGPLLNMRGEVVGINSRITGRAGIGFSITSEDVTKSIEQFRASGNISSAWLGIITDLSNPLKPEEGVLVEAVRPGSPADRAGIRAGDIILGAGDAVFAKLPGANAQLLNKALAPKKPGEKITLKVAQGEDVRDIEVTLGDKK